MYVVLRCFVKIWYQNATNVLGSLTLPGPTRGAYKRDRIYIREKVIKMFHGLFVHVAKTLIDLQILGCEMHQNAFGGRDPTGPAGGAIVLPRPPSWIKATFGIRITISTLVLCKAL